MDNRESIKNRDLRKICIRVILWIPALIMMLIIFLYSSKPAQVSANTSTPIAKIILKMWEAFFGNVNKTQRLDFLDTISFIVRKGAHITEYFMLALCLSLPFWKSGIRGKKFFFLTFLTCVAYAGTDEFHQLFIEGRSGSLKDVGIDSIGCAAGTFLFYIVVRRIKKKSNQGKP